MCVMSATSFPSGRQGMWDMDLDLEDLDLCFAGGSRHDNELLKLCRKLFGFLREIFVDKME